MAESRRGTARRVLTSRAVLLGPIDQAAQSLVTLTATLLLARVASVSTFSSWALAFAAHFVILAIARSMCTVPLVASLDLSRTDMLVAFRPIRRLAALWALLDCVAVSALLMHRGEGQLALGLAVLAPGLLILDNERFLLINIGGLPRAAWSSVVYVAFWATLAIVLLLTSGLGVASLHVAWSVSVWVTVLSLWFRRPLVSHSMGFGDYFTRHVARISWLTVDGLVVVGSTQMIYPILAVLFSEGDVAGFRLVSTVLLGPVTTVLAGAAPQVQLRARRLLIEDDLPRVRYETVLIVTTVAAGLALLGLGAALLPHGLWGVFGDIADPARHMVGPATAVTISASASAFFWMNTRYLLGIGRTTTWRAGTAIALFGMLWLSASWVSSGASFTLFAVVGLAVPTCLFLTAATRRDLPASGLRDKPGE